MRMAGAIVFHRKGCLVASIPLMINLPDIPSNGRIRLSKLVRNARYGLLTLAALLAMIARSASGWSSFERVA